MNKQANSSYAGVDLERRGCCLFVRQLRKSKAFSFLFKGLLVYLCGLHAIFSLFSGAVLLCPDLLQRQNVWPPEKPRRRLQHEQMEKAEERLRVLAVSRGPESHWNNWLAPYLLITSGSWQPRSCLQIWLAVSECSTVAITASRSDLAAAL